ncbi:MAG: hypothetical protein D6826_00570 [Alphaproteobacteria bacterium]|nr:MAG: hypothetical protein D6826_00570 [Alphaproteobacteria bacterium]
MLRVVRRASALWWLGLLALGACGPVPRPFAHAPGTTAGAAIAPPPLHGEAPRDGATAPAPDSAPVRLVILPVEGAPGDAARSLPRALAAALRGAGFAITDRIAENDLLILGDVALAPPRGGIQDVTITWTVTAARNDRDLGQVVQRNRVAAGSLDGPWGPVAAAVAREAAAGLGDLIVRTALDQAGRQRAQQLRIPEMPGAPNAPAGPAAMPPPGSRG